eukprot:g7203.t1
MFAALSKPTPSANLDTSRSAESRGRALVWDLATELCEAWVQKHYDAVGEELGDFLGHGRFGTGDDRGTATRACETAARQQLVSSAFPSAAAAEAVQALDIRGCCRCAGALAVVPLAVILAVMFETPTVTMLRTGGSSPREDASDAAPLDPRLREPTSLDATEEAKDGPAAPRMGSGNMFDRIAFAYDAANKWMSFGLDQHWRTTMVKDVWRALFSVRDCLQLRPDDRVLDLATGTADVSILVGQELRRLGASVRDAVLGVDPSNEMLRRGVAKVQQNGLEHVVIDAEGTLAEKSPGAREASVDKISMSFGIRNVPDRAKALREMRRVLDPSQQSRVCILELSLPTGETFLSRLARSFITEVVPLIGWVATMGSGGEEYEYLERSILRFPKPLDFARELQAAWLPVERITSAMAGKGSGRARVEPGVAVPQCELGTKIPPVGLRETPPRAIFDPMAPKLTVLFVLLGLVEARHCLYDNKGSLSACGRGCAMRPDSNICVSGCLSTRGVSRGCATCLGNGFQCAVREASTILAAAAFPEPKAVAEEPKPNQTETVASETSERSGRCWEDQVSLKACGTQRGRGMSSNCANCFGDKVDCTIRKCLSQCASDSQSYACTSCATLGNLLSGAARVSLQPLVELARGRGGCPSTTHFACQPLFVWYDFFSCPQGSSEAARAHRHLAISSIPSYVARSFFFMILCPPLRHQEPKPRGEGV